MKYSFKANTWEYNGPAAWVFVSLPRKISQEIDFRFSQSRSGFGSIKAAVTVGNSKWRTSIFPNKSKGFDLPIKRAVREAEKVSIGDKIHVKIDIVE